MVGDAGVGKSCIVHRIINNVFTEHSATTVGANHHTHVLHIDADVVEMRLWVSTTPNGPHYASL